MVKRTLVDFDFENVGRIFNLPTPSTPNEPATRNYVDNADKFGFYYIPFGKSFTVPEYQLYKTPCLEIRGSLVMYGAMEVK